MSYPDRAQMARGQVKRWEKRFPTHIARAIVECEAVYTHSPRAKEVYQDWLKEHPAPIQGTTIHIEQFREAPRPTTEEDAVNVPSPDETEYIVNRRETR